MRKVGSGSSQQINKALELGAHHLENNDWLLRFQPVHGSSTARAGPQQLQIIAGKELTWTEARREQQHRCLPGGGERGSASRAGRAKQPG